MEISQFFQNNLVWVGLAGASGGVLLFEFIKGSADQLSVAEAIMLMNRENAVVVDVRDQQEWSQGHITHAHHIPIDQLSARSTELEKFKSKPVIVVCERGARSQGGCRTLKKLGFTRPYSLKNGLVAWQEAGLPLITGR